MAALNTNVVYASRKAGMFAGIFAAFQAWKDERATRNVLSKLSDRELEDIGLCRGDIDAVAAGNLR